MATEPIQPAEESFTIQTRDQAEAAMSLIAVLTLQRDQEQAAKNVQLLEAGKRDARISELGKRMQRYEAALQDWATRNREALGLTGKEGEKKSMELRQGAIGFRWSNRSVRLLPNWDEIKALAALKKMAGFKKAFLDYIRKKEELNKLRILEDSKPEVGKLDDKTLRRFGITIGRTEVFFIEPKLEQPPTVT
ncbi:MAG: host-nuclease inhibitor Gam family protein [Patescibacteria group bacterium]|nr:host-nuclease inhibitor Gam family protein [Patescibacteria group bacterium]